MAPSASKLFQAPKTNDTVDQGKFMKLAQKVEDTLTNSCLNNEPKQIDPDKIFVSPYNRMGANPNTKRVHFNIIGSLHKSG